MKELLERLAAAIERGNKADEAWEAAPEDKEKEAEFTAAYNAEWRIREELAAAIVQFTKSIDFITAFKMTYNPEVILLLDCVK